MKPVLFVVCAVAFSAAWPCMPSAAAQEKGTLISDIYKEWDDSAYGTQPLGSWLLLHGTAKYQGLGQLSALDRYETAISGNSSLSAWSFGASIFNIPSVSRDTSRSQKAVFVYPGMDGAGNQNKGCLYIEWTSGDKQSIKLVLNLQNVGTDVKIGDGMTVRVYQLDPGDSPGATQLEPIMIPSAASNQVPIIRELSLDVESGQKILIEIDPNANALGDSLALSAAVYRQP
jgi:hypothetical protein